MNRTRTLSLTLILALISILTAGCTPDITVNPPDVDIDLTVEVPDGTDGDDDDSTASDDDDSATQEEEGCNLYLPSDPWTTPACFGPTGSIPEVETLTDGMWIQVDMDDPIYMYYVLGNQTHHVPTLQRFESWRGEDACIACSGVASASTDLLQNLEIGQNVTARPGTIISIEADTSLFVIDACRTARPILPSVAEEIYGDEWEQHLLQFPYKPEVFFVDYIMGPPVNSSSQDEFDLSFARSRTIDQELLGIGCQSTTLTWGYSPNGSSVEVQAGAQAVNFGDLYFTAEGPETVHLQEVPVGMRIRANSATFQAPEDGGYSTYEMVDTCWLEAPGPLVLGDATPVGTGSAFWSAPNNYFENGTLTLSVMCDISNVAPAQSVELMAFVELPMGLVAETTSGAPLSIGFASNNGNPGAPLRTVTVTPSP